jgi:hypothetical protein
LLPENRLLVLLLIVIIQMFKLVNKYLLAGFSTAILHRCDAPFRLLDAEEQGGQLAVAGYMLQVTGLRLPDYYQAPVAGHL